MQYNIEIPESQKGVLQGETCDAIMPKTGE